VGHVARSALSSAPFAVTVYDDVAACYDASRGGELRGDNFASELDSRLPAGPGPVLEVGVGTGVVALGLARRGRSVIGVDLSAAMLSRARARLGPVVVRGDSRSLPLGDGSVSSAVSVWVVHAVMPPQAMFSEVVRVLRPGGRYLVCPTNRTPPGAVIEPILAAMFARAEQMNPTWRRREVNAGDILAWGEETGFSGLIESLQPRSWITSAAEQVQSIHDRVWPALRGLDDDRLHEVVQPALDALASLPAGPIEQRAEADVVVLTRP
jgi:ubiquinone/menaquinone biosynthesis C-methylase UbiE